MPSYLPIPTLLPSLPSRLLLFLALFVPQAAGAATIVLIGDSITAGAVTGGGLPYATVLQQLRPQDEILNAGCGGATTGDWTRPPVAGFGCATAGAYELAAAPFMAANGATILLGVNDAIGFFEGTPIEPGEFRQNLEALVNRTLLDVAWVALMTPPANPFASVTVRTRLRGYRDEIFDLCGERADVLCGPDLQQILTGPATGLPGLHPDASGHLRIAQEVDGFLAQVIPEPGNLPLVAAGLAAIAARRRRVRR